MYLGPWLFLAWSGILSVAIAGDDFAAVPGTGWTDITQLQSTCSYPGYFVNPHDCSRFYQCVDHSTPEHKLFLRYDFNCPEGTAFDEANSICNYPGPSGCISSPGWGNGGWGQGWGNGWNKGHIWQATITKGPSWGTPGRQLYRVSTTAAPPLAANPAISLPAPTRIVHIPTSGWESFKIRNPGTSGVFQRVHVSSTPAPPVRVVDPGVFQSVKVVTDPTPGWAPAPSKTVFPVETGIFQSARVTTVPQAEWESPPQFPVVTQQLTPIVEGPGWNAPPPDDIRIHVSPSPAPLGWNAPPPPPPDDIRIHASPAPVPANPSVPIRVTYYPSTTPATPTIVPAWQSNRITPAPQPWQGARITQVASGHSHPTPLPWQGARVSSTPAPYDYQNSYVSSTPTPYEYQNSYVSSTPSPNWQPGTVLQTYSQQQPQPGVQYTWSQPKVTSQQVNIVQASNNAAPSGPVLTPPAGWENVRLTQLPSGYAWQSNNPVVSKSQSKAVITSQGEIGVQAQLTQQDDEAPSLQGGNFGIVQQVIEDQGQQQQGPKSHIQLIYDRQEKQNAISEVATQVEANEIQQGGVPPNLGSGNPGAVYEIVPSSGKKGRIYVIYAPVKGSKRDASEVPVIEVQVDDSSEEDNNNDNVEGNNNEGESNKRK